MPNRIEVQVEVTGNAQQQLASINLTLEQLSGSSGGLTGAIAGGNLLSGALQRLGTEALSGGQAILAYSANLEQARIGFTTLIGSADGAQKHLEALQTFAKTTPFEFKNLVEASQKLQGVGIAADQVIPLLTDVGNALAAAGRIGDLPEATKALGDIQAKGKLAGQEIIQLANSGIPALDILSKALGKSKADVIALGEAGQISSDLFFKALHNASEQRFGDAMAAQSRTFNGALSNINDALFITGSKAFEPLFQSISDIAVRLSDEVGKTDSFEEVGNKIVKAMFAGVGAVIDETLKDLVADINKKLVAQTFQNGDLLALTVGRGNAAGIRKSLFGTEDTSALKNFSIEISGIAPAVAKLPSVQEKLQIAASVKDVLKLSDTLSKLSIADIGQKLDVAKANVGLQAALDPANSSTVQTIEAIGKLEQQALNDQIAVIQKAQADKIAALGDTDGDGTKRAAIERDSQAEIDRLTSQSAVNRINAEKQVREEIKKTRDELRAFVTDQAFSQNENNPAIRLFEQLDSVAERAQKRFGSLGQEVVNFAANIERGGLLKQLQDLQFASSLSGLKLNQQANALDRPLIGNSGEQNRQLSILQASIENLTRTFDLSAQAGFNRDLNTFNRNGNQPLPTENVAETFAAFKSATDIFTRFQLEQRGTSQISGIVAEVNRLQGLGDGSLQQSDLIAKAVAGEIGKIPADVLRNSQSPDIRALREDLARSADTQSARLKEAFQETLDRAAAGRQIVGDARDQLKLIGPNFGDEGRVKAIIATLSSLNPDELTGDLRQTQAKALRAQAGFELNRQNEGFEIAKKSLAALESMAKAIGGDKPLLVRDADADKQQPIEFTATIKDGSVDARVTGPAMNNNNNGIGGAASPAFGVKFGGDN